MFSEYLLRIEEKILNTRLKEQDSEKEGSCGAVLGTITACQRQSYVQQLRLAHFDHFLSSKIINTPLECTIPNV